MSDFIKQLRQASLVFIQNTAGRRFRQEFKGIGNLASGNLGNSELTGN